MEIIQQFIVKYDESKETNALAILFKTTNGYYIKYLDVDGMGWSDRIRKIADDEAQKLII